MENIKKLFTGSFDPSKDKVFEEKYGNVFVFGSNLSGHHGGGAAAVAHKKYGAEMGNGEGLMGIRYVDRGTELMSKWRFDGFSGVNGTLSYALPTKGFDIETLPLCVIDYFISRLCAETNRKTNSSFSWFVTRVGCGLGGYNDDEISSLFRNYSWPNNVVLPDGWE